MRKIPGFAIVLLLLSASLFAQGKRLWVLRDPGEMLEYDPATFAVKQKVKVPAEAVKSAGSISVNHLGRILYVPPVSLPLSEDDTAAPHKVWIWNGQVAATIDQGIEHKEEKIGSNQAVTESAPAAFLSADGNHLLWFANQERRLQREDVDLSSATTWQAWQTDLNGRGREEIASLKLPDCRCPTGSCEESCPTGVVWTPDGGVGKFFLMTQFVAARTTPTYQSTSRFSEQGDKWTADPQSEPLQRMLDAASDGSVMAEAIPDTGCCGWSNQSNDQTLVLANGKKTTVFDEQATYKNADYDVSFYTANARLSPDLGSLAMTIVATAEPNKAIQLSEQGQANPEESEHIRKALLELPAVDVKSVEDPSTRLAFVPHATLVGWISAKELLIVEDHVLVLYNVGTGSRKKSSVRVEDVGRVFLR